MIGSGYNIYIIVQDNHLIHSLIDLLLVNAIESNGMEIFVMVEMSIINWSENFFPKQHESFRKPF